jgi:DNA polymerase
MERYFPGQSISRIHGQAKRVGNVFYLPMFHPAAALRNPAWRQEMSKDIRRIPALLAELDGPPPTAPDPDQGAGSDGEYTQLSLF